MSDPTQLAARHAPHSTERGFRAGVGGAVHAPGSASDGARRWSGPCSVPPSVRMPVLFVAHGAPVLLDDLEWVAQLAG